MGLPSPFDYLVSSVSSPFDYLVQQIQTDLDHAADLCEEIRQNRHVGHNPTELNALEKSLREGSSFIRSQEKAAKDSSGADLEGGDEIARSEFITYTREVESICQRLESISHHHHNHHHHHSKHRSLLFSPPPPPPPSPEKVGFHDMRLKWENSRNGVSQTLASLKQRLETKKKERSDEERKKKEEEKEKKDADEKKQEVKVAEEKKQMGKEEESTEEKA